MALETKQPEMEEKIKQDNLKIQDNKVEIKKEPEDPEENGEISQNLNNILNRMVQFGDKIFVPVSDEKEKIYNPEKIKKDVVLEPQDSINNLFYNPEQDLLHHKKVHVEKKQLIVEKNYPLKGHMELVHEGKNPCQCKTCGASFAQNAQLKLHITSVHEGKKSFQCNICDSCFTQKSNLKKHILSVHEGNKPFQCNLCASSFTEKSTLKNHITSVHEKKKLFQCTICYVRFARNTNLKQHLISVHEGKKPFQCENCDYRSAQKSDLAKHVISVHKKHIKIKHETNVIYSCSICKKRLTSKSKWHIHNRNMHEGKAEFKKKATKETKSLLRTNQSNLMEEALKKDIDKNPFKCEMCNETFSEKVQIIEHVLKVHEEKMPEINKMYKCHICDLNFGYEQSLKLHKCNLNRTKNTDLGKVDKPFKCEVCSASFMLVGSLNTHSKLVHRVKKSFICKLCNIDFQWENTLKKHHEVVHKGKNQAKDDINDIMHKSSSDFQGKIQTEDAPSIKIVNVYSLPVNEMIKEHESKNIEKSVMTKQNSNNESNATKAFAKNQTVHENEKPKIDMNNSKDHCTENYETSGQNLTKEIELKENLGVKTLPKKIGHNFEKQILSKKQDSNASYVTSFHCSICKIPFSTKFHLNKHRLDRHSVTVHERKKKIEVKERHSVKSVPKNIGHKIEVKKPALECLICNVCFPSKFYLNSHTSTVHRGEYRHHCSHCNDYFYNEYNLKAHISNVHERKNSIEKDNIEVQGPNQFKCKICEAKFFAIGGMNHHMAKIHGVVESIFNFKCNICGEFHKSNADLKRHNETVHEQKNPSDQTIVLKKSKNHTQEEVRHDEKLQLNDPSTTVHEIEKPKDNIAGDHSFKKSGCETSVIKTGHEKAKQTKSSEQTVPIPNPNPSNDKSVNSFKFKPEYNDVKKHFETEKLGKKRFTCSICNQIFILYKSLLKHIGSDHEKEKAFKCKLCGASFNLENSLVLHIKAHEGKNIEEKMDTDGNEPVHEKIEPYKCSFCDKTFEKTSKHFVSQLKNHLEDQHMNQISQVHGGKSVQCPFCNMKTIDSYKLKEHIDSEHSSIVHDGKNPNQIEDATSQVESVPKRKAPVFSRSYLTSSDSDQYQNPDPINSQKLPENTITKTILSTTKENLQEPKLNSRLLTKNAKSNNHINISAATTKNQASEGVFNLLFTGNKDKNVGLKKVTSSSVSLNVHKMPKCKICNVPCISEYSLKSHMMLVHEGIKQTFHEEKKLKPINVSNDNLDVKMITIDKEKENSSAIAIEKMPQCNVCDLTCISEDSLKSHMMLVHEGKKQKTIDVSNDNLNVKMITIDKENENLNHEILMKELSEDSTNSSVHEEKKHHIECNFDAQIIEVKPDWNKSVICKEKHLNNDNLDVEMIAIEEEKENLNYEHTIEEFNEHNHKSIHEEKKHQIECNFEANIEVNKSVDDNLDVEMIPIEEERDEINHENTMKELSEHNNTPSVHEEKKHQIECNFDARIIEFQPDYLNKSVINQKEINNDFSEHDPLDLTPHNEKISNSSNDMVSEGEENYETVCDEITNKVRNEESKSAHEEIKHQSNDQIMKTVNLDANQTTAQIHFLPTINGVTLLKKSQNAIGTFIKLPEEKPLKRPICTKKLALEKNLKINISQQENKKLRHILPKSKSSNEVNNKHQKCKELREHKAKAQKVFDCKKCKTMKIFLNKEDLKNHIENFHEEKKRLDINHVMVIQDENEKNVASVHERKNIGSVREGRNIASVHEEKNQSSETTFYCTVCYDKFSDSNSFTSHMDKAHNKKIYACNVCHRRYKNKRSYNQHIESSHKQELGSNLKQSNNKSMESYSNVNHENLKKKAEEIESNKIRSVEDRKRKMTVQIKRLQIETLKCHVCAKILASKKSLKTHVETIHDRKKQSTFKCDICSKEFNAVKDIDDHISEIHIDVAYVRQVLNKHIYSAQKGSQTLQCQFCDTTFSQKCDFNRHVSAVHEGKKKFKCAICDACQINEKCVKQHMKSFCCAFLA